MPSVLVAVAFTSVHLESRPISQIEWPPLVASNGMTVEVTTQSVSALPLEHVPSEPSTEPDSESQRASTRRVPFGQLVPVVLIVPPGMRALDDPVVSLVALAAVINDRSRDVAICCPLLDVAVEASV